MTQPLIALPGKFAIETYHHYWLTAVDGGGRSTDAIHTDSARGSDITPFEEFTLWRDPSRYQPDTGPHKSDPVYWYHRYAIQTANGNYLTADAGGGSNSPNAIQTDRTEARTWEMFRILNGLTLSELVRKIGLAGQYTHAAFAVASGHYYLSAIHGGGETLHPFRTDATEVRQWEMFQLVRVGRELGSGLSYFIVPKSSGVYLSALNGGGETKNAILPAHLYVPPLAPQQPLWNAVFRLEKQPNNTYALRTSNGNYVTADQGGGREASADRDTLQTNRTQPQAWEQFVFYHGGKEDGTFVIQTHEGSNIGPDLSTSASVETAERFTLVLADR
jgi:hypothetical protein